MKKKLSRMCILAVLFLCIGTSAVSAQSYSKYSVSNPNGTRTFYGISNSKNTKIYSGKEWFFKVTSISFSSSTSGTAGMAFTPMRRSSEGIYMLCGANKGWATTTTKYLTPGWGSASGQVGDYYLGVRLDDRLTKCTASVAGDWNAN